MTGTWHVHRAADWQALAPADPRVVMKLVPAGAHFAKQGRAISRWCPADGLAVFVKRHFRESWWRALLAFITRRPKWSAAWQEYKHLRWATANGFAVPRPAAVGVCIGPGVKLAGFLAIDELTGQLPLHELIPIAERTLSNRKFLIWKRGLVAELARLVRELHGMSRFHKDLYLCHFYAPAQYANAPPPRWTGRVAMIDLHRLGHHPWTWRWWQLKDLAQLLYSSEVLGVTARDRLRFWTLYMNSAHATRWDRIARSIILMRWKNYQRHNGLRRQAA